MNCTSYFSKIKGIFLGIFFILQSVKLDDEFRPGKVAHLVRNLQDLTSSEWTYNKLVNDNRRLFITVIMSIGLISLVSQCGMSKNYKTVIEYQLDWKATETNPPQILIFCQNTLSSIPTALPGIHLWVTVVLGYDWLRLDLTN